MSTLAKRVGSKMLVLSEADVRKCLSMKSCLEINRQALLSVASDSAAAQVGGKGQVPLRIGLPGPVTASISNTSTGTADDWTLFKPAAFYHHSSNSDNQPPNTTAAATTSATTTTNESLMGMKIVSIRSQNPDRGLPLVTATIAVLNTESGIVQAILNGTYLTGMRTAASSGLATQLMRPDLTHLVVFGAGLQAECHIDAIKTAIGRTIPKITICNRSRPRAEQLKEKIRLLSFGESCDIVLLEDKAGVEKALSTADVVAATTNAMTPLFDGSVLPPGCHVNGIGSYTPEMQEIDINTVNRSRIIIDTHDAKTVGDLKHLQDVRGHPMALLGDMLADTTSDSPWGTNIAGSENIDCTFYKGVGTAIQDVMTADLVVQRARELGIGTEVDMS